MSVSSSAKACLPARQLGAQDGPFPLLSLDRPRHPSLPADGWVDRSRGLACLVSVDRRGGCGVDWGGGPPTKNTLMGCERIRAQMDEPSPPEGLHAYNVNPGPDHHAPSPHPLFSRLPGSPTLHLLPFFCTFRPSAFLFLHKTTFHSLLNPSLLGLLKIPSVSSHLPPRFTPSNNHISDRSPILALPEEDPVCFHSFIQLLSPTRPAFNLDEPDRQSCQSFESL
ncbi:hypothetical protein F5X68DRAFT_10660 [Plectosphaerella plurivora]|uniref:Uncharacterized protein n=1 Tax=Plectosphaerella plurivora TaxID=936078 RepID=A0A9P8VDL4_9PEZI|nr:hypothetical protein F5X68DRAFT_10660 [Plectosphaerella plurivora]